MDADDPLWKLIQKCKLGGAVRVTRQAVMTAESDFGLASEAEVIAFIATPGGIENPRTKPTRNLQNNDSGVPIPVYSYCFTSGAQRGYLAFYFRNDSWSIKSFKRDEDPPMPTRPLRR